MTGPPVGANASSYRHAGVARLAGDTGDTGDTGDATDAGEARDQARMP
jgi:hypothetical protein